MIEKKRALAILSCLIVLVFSLQCSAAGSQVTSRTFSYREYKVADSDVRFLLPDGWAYLDELSNENMSIFSGENEYSAVVVQTLSLPDYYKENISALGDLFLSYYSGGGTSFSLLASPVTYYLNGNEAVILIYVDSSYEVPAIRMEIIALSNDEIVSVIIQDSEEGFLSSFEIYEMILQSLTFNQTERSVLKDILRQ